MISFFGRSVSVILLGLKALKTKKNAKMVKIS